MAFTRNDITKVALTVDDYLVVSERNEDFKSGVVTVYKDKYELYRVETKMFMTHINELIALLEMNRLWKTSM